MTKNVLNFNLEATDEKLTPRVCVIILGEYLKGLGLEDFCNSNLPLYKVTIHIIHLNLYNRLF